MKPPKSDQGSLARYKESSGKIIDKAFEELKRRAKEMGGANEFQVFVCYQQKVLNKEGMQNYNWIYRAREFMRNNPYREGNKKKTGEVINAVDESNVARFDPRLPDLGKR